VKNFASPVFAFKDTVAAASVHIENLSNNLDDLKNHSESALEMVR